VKYTPAELAAAFGELLARLAGALDGAGVPWMLVGGLAVGAWTEPRGTKDCDLAVSAADPAVLERALGAIGLRVVRGRLDQVAHGGTVRLAAIRPDAPPLVVDLLCAGTDFERAALRRCRRATVLGVPLAIVSPDDLVVYKLIAGRPQDLADVDRLLRFGRAPEDEAEVRRWLGEFGVADRLDAALVAARR
jgi:hypothetical protein